MHYEIDIKNFFSKNTAIIGGKETGKTNILKDLVRYFYKEEYSIILFDSATSKGENSLLVDSDNKYYHNIIIPSPSEEKINFVNPNSDDYPLLHVYKSYYNIYFFDVAKYLEKSNNTSNLEEKETLLSYYKQFIVQGLIVMLPVVSKKRAIVIMDEIDLVPNVKRLIEIYNSLGIYVIIAVNSIESLSTSSVLFNVINLD